MPTFPHYIRVFVHGCCVCLYNTFSRSHVSLRNCCEIWICAFLEFCQETCYVDITLLFAATSRWQHNKRWDVIKWMDMRMKTLTWAENAESLRPCFRFYICTFPHVCFYLGTVACVFVCAHVHIWVGSGGLWSQQMDIWSSFAPCSKTHTCTPHTHTDTPTHSCNINPV